jgi:uncharacterized membrane protein
MKPTTRGILVATAAAGLFLAGAVQANAASHEEAKGSDVMCEGVNECKGKSACATGSSSCTGQNECKGKGVLKMSAEDCKAKGGTAQAKN